MDKTLNPRQLRAEVWSYCIQDLPSEVQRDIERWSATLSTILFTWEGARKLVEQQAREQAQLALVYERWGLGSAKGSSAKAAQLRTLLHVMDGPPASQDGAGGPAG